ncbi:zinc-binding dehydrogenase [uncultured Allofournierella sp.]|uniref:zinc-binding dehydrogenase n=1 Tax=uncultured Allofournierella sp. TaxID=1940258 RepID=UPI0025E19981|nr:zinc-binding dehydrogenase [uncultured Fournierella sp.]
MKGYAVLAPGEHGWLEREKPAAGPMDAVVRPIAVAPCSSDTHTMHMGSTTGSPVILGHEAVAEVVEVGALVRGFRPGDIVVVPCVTPDWEAPALQQRGANNAHDYASMASFKYLTQKDGVFAEFFHVNNADANLVLLPKDVSVDAALMTVDMMSTGFYGAEMADIQLGDTVVVFGIGPVGLMAVAGARLRGAGRIIGIGTRPNCAELAREYGATDIVSYKDGDVVQQILELEGGKVDRAILAGGDASTLNQALSVVKSNGVVSNVTFLDPTDTYHIPAPLWGLGMSDISICGGFCPGGAYRIQKMLRLIQNGRVAPEKMLNYQYDGFDKIPEAFVAMDQKPRDLIKPVVHIQW